jgi:polyisoprenoid-binding protein YceI
MKLVFVLLGTFVATAAVAANEVCVVPNRGHFRTHVGTAGLFGAFGHEHLVEAKTIKGCATIDPKDPARASIKLTFAAADLRVIDPGESANERKKVQEAMETEVLHVQEHPQITFQSTAIDPSESAGRFQVRGNLTIRGKTLSIVIPVNLSRLDDGTYRVVGHSRFKQTSFGIKPVRVGGGTVKVKDEVNTEFEIFLK